MAITPLYSVIVLQFLLLLYFVSVYDVNHFDAFAFPPTAPGNQSQTITAQNNLTTSIINRPPVVNVDSNQIADEKTIVNLDSIAVDSSDDMYVTDEEKIEKYDSNGNFVTKWGSEGSSDGCYC